MPTPPKRPRTAGTTPVQRLPAPEVRGTRSLPFDFGEGVPPRPKGWRSDPVQDAPKGARPFVPFEWDDDGMPVGGAKSPTVPEAARPPGTAGGSEAPAAEPKVFSVSELANLVKRGLDQAFPLALLVEGEVVSAKAAASGHVYFALKSAAGEPEATLDIVAYKNGVSAKGRALVRDGARLRLFGRPIFWAPRGRLQFVCDRIEAAGAGAHLEALEALKKKLAAEGLFDPENKRPLPKEPRIVGVVTSRSGAVIHDIRNVAFRRGGAHLLLAPAVVQGAGASEALVRALTALGRVDAVDVIILGRGGGSSDDLAAFNDEALVRAIAASPVPIVAAVGHEVDFTLVDFVADARAATPSQAAELVVPDRAAQAEVLRERFARLRRAASARLTRAALRVAALEKKVQDPRLRIAQAAQRLDDLSERLERAATRAVRHDAQRLAPLERRLHQADPKRRVAAASQQLSKLDGRLRHAGDRLVARSGSRLSGLAGRLDALSPLRVLGRGYALAQRVDDGSLVRGPSQAPPGTALRIRLASGALDATVTSTTSESDAMRDAATEPGLTPREDSASTKAHNQ